MAKFFTIVLAVIVAAALAVYFLLPKFLDQDKVIAFAAQVIEEETGATLVVGGDLELSVFPVVGVSFSDAAITMPGKTQPDLEVAAAHMGVKLWPLFSGSVEVDSIDINGVTARLESVPEETRVDTSGFSDAELDAYYAEHRKKRDAAKQGAGAEAALAVPLALSVSSLQVSDARIETLDTQTNTTSVVEISRLAAKDLNLTGNAIPLDLALRIPGEQPITVELSGEIKVDQNDESVSFEGLQIDVAGATAQPLRVLATGLVDLARQSADTQLKLTLADLAGQGQIRYASFESPQIDADLRLNLLDPVLFALAGPEAAESGGETAPGSGDEPLPLDALRSIDTRASLHVEQARFGAHEITNLKADLRALEGVIKITGVTGTLHGGELDAGATFNGRHNTATLDTSGGVTALNLAAAMAASESPDLLSGKANLNWQLKSRGQTPNQLVQALAGPIELTTENVVLRGTSVEKMLCQAVALTNQEALSATFPPDTQFTELSAKIQVADGQAKLNPLQADLAHMKLAGDGDLALLDQDFQATFKARLSPTLEELDHACRVSKRLTSIDFPVTCKGNVSADPKDWCSVDTEEILRGLAVNEGRKKLEKEAGKLLNKFLRKE